MSVGLGAPAGCGLARLASLWLLTAIASIACIVSGCAPSLEHLVRTRQHGEALCAVTLPEQRPSDSDRARVIDAAVADAEPLLFLRAVTREEIEAALGARGAQFNRDFAVVIVGSADHWISVHANTAVRFVLRGQPLPMLDANEAAFAGAFGERLPSDRTVVQKEGRLERLAGALLPAQGKSLGATAGGMTAGMLELLTLGLVPFTEIFPGKKPDRTTVIEPTPAQKYAAAPATMTFHGGLARALQDVPASWAPTAVLIERPREGGVPIVQVERRLVNTTRSSGSCSATVTFEQQLIAAPTLEESILRTFPGPPDALHRGGVRAVGGFETRRVTFPERQAGRSSRAGD